MITADMAWGTAIILFIAFQCIVLRFDIEDLKDNMMKELKQLMNKQDWIPVSERMPEENGEYLVTVKQGYVTTAIWVGTAEFWNEVCAWMPKPEKYEASPKGRK